MLLFVTNGDAGTTRARREDAQRARRGRRGPGRDRYPLQLLDNHDASGLPALENRRGSSRSSAFPPNGPT